MSEIKVEIPGTEETAIPDKEGKKADTKAELAEKNKALEAELEKMKAQMSKQTEGSAASAVMAEALPDKENDPRRIVCVRLPKSKYQSAPMYVAIGDYNALIPRGVNVMVPYFVAEHVRECEEQDEKTASMLTKMQNDYAAETDRLMNR